MKTKELIYEGATLCYRIYGKGRPVILIHGFGEEANVWDGLVSHLQNRYQLIIPDLPGSGDSAMIPDMSIAGMAETIHAIVHEENIHTCTLIGHSMGGYITLAFAEKYWNHLDAFGLFHSTSYADSEEKKATRRKGIAFGGELGGGAAELQLPAHARHALLGEVPLLGLVEVGEALVLVLLLQLRHLPAGEQRGHREVAGVAEVAQRPAGELGHRHERPGQDGQRHHHLEQREAAPPGHPPHRGASGMPLTTRARPVKGCVTTV